MKVLVSGGAGYIGSVTVKRLQEQGFEVVVFDNLEYGHKDAVNCRLITGDLTNKEFLFSSLKNEEFDGVIHFAAYALAGESMKDPYKYFYANLTGGLNLLEFMRDKNINNIVFSSTCAIYGFPDNLPVREDEAKKPLSVYGESKLMFERILDWYEKIYGIKSIRLRYFNAAGASIDGTLGEDHSPETHIIPLAINTALGKRDEFNLYGNDYKTPDGSCIRDYIHVEDLASVHINAIKKLEETKKSDYFNLGTGKGYSNLEVLDMVKKISGVDFKVNISERREGDPDIIYADNEKAKKELSFDPKYSDLETIVKTAWQWHSKNAA
jgi:UDP-glucose 4-epimerase